MKCITSISAKSLPTILMSGGLLTTAHAQYDAGVAVDISFAFYVDCSTALNSEPRAKAEELLKKWESRLNHAPDRSEMQTAEK